MKILFDKDATGDGLHTGWGVSFLFNDTVLFDTGENGEWLMNNMNRLHVDIQKISAVVVSHDHWDHTGGLWELLQRKPDITVYGCPGFGAEFKEKVCVAGARLVENCSSADITPNLSTSGEIPFVYKNAPMSEQSLIAHSPESISIITGCAHPGITEIIHQSIDLYPDRKIDLVAGGFHLKDTVPERIREIADEFRRIGVVQAAPTHCSGDEAQRIFKAVYGNDYVEITTGKTIYIS